MLFLCSFSTAVIYSYIYIHIIHFHLFHKVHIYWNWLQEQSVAVLQIGRSLVRSQLVSSEFFIDIKSFRSHYGPWVDSASNRNEYQGHFLGGKGGRCVGLTTLPPSCAVVTKSKNLNFLEPTVPIQACNGTDLPFFFVHLVYTVCAINLFKKNHTRLDTELTSQ